MDVGKNGNDDRLAQKRAWLAPRNGIAQMKRNIVSCVIAVAVAAGLTACSGSSSGIPTLSSIGSIGSKKSVSETDRVFLMAAGSWDRNRDNTITCEEWKAYASELFDGADANRDGALEQTEWSQVVKTDRMFETANIDYYDANNDNKVTRAEFVDRENAAFRLMDTAKTCQLSGTQVAGARSTTEFDVGGKKAQDGDVREASGEQGKAANGGLGR